MLRFPAHRRSRYVGGVTAFWRLDTGARRVGEDEDIFFSDGQMGTAGYLQRIGGELIAHGVWCVSLIVIGS